MFRNSVLVLPWVLLGLVPGFITLSPAQVAAPATASAVPQPKAPYVASLPVQYHWIITFSYFEPPQAAVTGNAAAGGDAAAKPPAAPVNSTTPPKPAKPDVFHPLSVEIFKVGKFRRYVVKMGDGSNKQFDMYEQLKFRQTDRGNLLETTPEFTPFYFYGEDLPFTDVAQLANYKDFVASPGGGAGFYHYKKDLDEAWIAADTGLPVTTKSNGTYQADFKFLDQPDLSIFPPDEVAQVKNMLKTAAAIQNMR